jgi:hypothetical protein
MGEEPPIGETLSTNHKWTSQRQSDYFIRTGRHSGDGQAKKFAKPNVDLPDRDLKATLI